MNFTIIAAVDKKLGIGKDNTMPWHISADLKHFANTTKGGTVMMGRKTWESIPERYRPFSGRLNIVLSRSNLEETIPNDVEWAPGIHRAIQISEEKKPGKEIFLIGGGQLFREFIRAPECKKLILTEIDAEFDCDTHFPPIPSDFERKKESLWQQEKDLKFRFVTYERS